MPNPNKRARGLLAYAQQRPSSGLDLGSYEMPYMASNLMGYFPQGAYNARPEDFERLREMWIAEQMRLMAERGSGRTSIANRRYSNPDEMVVALRQYLDQGYNQRGSGGGLLNMILRQFPGGPPR